MPSADVAFAHRALSAAQSFGMPDAALAVLVKTMALAQLVIDYLANKLVLRHSMPLPITVLRQRAGRRSLRERLDHCIAGIVEFPHVIFPGFTAPVASVAPSAP